MAIKLYRTVDSNLADGLTSKDSKGLTDLCPAPKETIELSSEIMTPQTQQDKVLEITIEKTKEELKEFYAGAMDLLEDTYIIPKKLFIASQKRVLSDQEIIDDVFKNLPLFTDFMGEETLHQKLLEDLKQGREISYYHKQALSLLQPTS
jgi:hypothetical protein